MDLGIQDRSNLFSKNTLQTSDGSGFFVDPAFHYHGAAGREKEIRKNGREGIFFENKFDLS
jgi:hypothetical protein